MTPIKLSTIQTAISETSISLVHSNDLHYWNPIEMAISVLLHLSGNPKEVFHYYNSTTASTNAYLVFKKIMVHTAYQIFKQHPDIAEETLKHPFIKNKLSAAPIAKLELDDKVADILGSLMADISYYQALRDKGYMSWDDGTYEAAMIIAYGWRKAIPFKVKLTQSSTDVHFATRDLIRSALKEHPNNPYLQFVAQRYSLAWYIKNPPQLQQSLDYFQILAKSRKRSTTAVIMKTLGQSSLVDLGLRYRDPTLIKSALKKLERKFSPTQKKQGTILFAKAWANVYSNKKTSAKTLALKIARHKSPFLKEQAANILHTIGEEKKAVAILKKINLQTNK